MNLLTISLPRAGVLVVGYAVAVAYHMRPLIRIVLVACSLLTGCGHQPASESRPSMRPPRDAAAAGDIATNTAMRAGIRLAEFEEPKVDWDANRGQWEFFYTERPPGRPGGHFLITVDQSGEAKLHGGK